MPDAPLRVISFLAPNMLPVYAYLAERLGQRLGRAAQLVVGESYDELKEADVAFVCGLAYVERADAGLLQAEPIAAPLLAGARYAGRPVYYSDVIVRRDSPVGSFAELRGRSWAYNEPHSHSGYGVTRFFLARMGENFDFFSRVVQSGWHEESIRLVCSGEVDASAIDSQVLAVALRERPDRARELRVIESFGPSTIQPIVVSRRLAQEDRDAIRDELLELRRDASARQRLAYGFIEEFVAVDDAAYDDIRRMRAAGGNGADLHFPAMSRQ